MLKQLHSLYIINILIQNNILLVDSTHILLHIVWNKC